MSLSKTITLLIPTVVIGLGSGMLKANEQEDYTVKLKQLQAIQVQEKGGDDLYISVTEFPSQGQPSHYQIPGFPTHWLSKYLTNVKDITLWKKNIQSCQDVKVIFSLVEEDFSPWNLDDLLGSVELHVSCKNGQWSSEWIIPNQSITKQNQQNKNDFEFSGKDANYRAQFSIESKPGIPLKK